MVEMFRMKLWVLSESSMEEHRIVYILLALILFLLLPAIIQKHPKNSDGAKPPPHYPPTRLPPTRCISPRRPISRNRRDQRRASRGQGKALSTTGSVREYVLVSVPDLRRDQHDRAGQHPERAGDRFQIVLHRLSAQGLLRAATRGEYRPL